MKILYTLLIGALASTSFGAAIVGSPSTRESRVGDEIVIAGQMFHTGTPVVLWTDPNGYDLTKTAPKPVTQPSTTNPAIVETLRGEGLSLDELKQHVDQFVIHFDACGTSRECYNVLLKRHLGVQLMCDLDGTIYQTMDLASEAFHATIANERSIGCETANIGGFEGPKIPANFTQWYRRGGGGTIITLPPKLADAGFRLPNFVGRPSRPDLISGNVQGKTYRQFDYTSQQYQALAHVAATLCTVLPKIQPDFPRQKLSLGTPANAIEENLESPRTKADALADPGQSGVLIPHALTLDQFAAFQGILGHYHIQANKDDPGPAFQWLRFIGEVRNLMPAAAKEENKRWQHQPVGLPTYRRHPTPLLINAPTTTGTTEPATEPSEPELGGESATP